MTQEHWKKFETGSAVVEDCSEWKIVAAVYGYGGNPADDSDGVKERCALIAAAPELLEAARDAANQLRTIAAIANHIPRKHAAQIIPLIRYGDIDEVVAKAEATK